MITATVPVLAVLAHQDRAAIADLPRTIAAHDAHLESLPTMTSVEVGGTAAAAPLPLPLTVAAWNLERCLFPADSAAMIADTGAALVLLSEMDSGMSRTGQTNTTAQVAEGLGMAYAYGVEFVELGLGSDTEREFCKDDHNTLGLHGNALLAATALGQPFLLRLPGERRWFTDGEQPRMGERIAVGAVIATEAGPLVALSTHLESVSDAAGRQAQVLAMIDLVDERFPGLPVLIGGDLNTGNHIEGGWQAETLFDAARARGFEVHGGPEDQVTTRPSLITRWPDRAMKLDWFLTRGLIMGETRIVPSLDPDGRPLSDHDMIVTQVNGLSR